MFWSISCPFKCTYCGNTKFIGNDKSYRVFRSPSVELLIREFKMVLAHHPHILTNVFHDHSLIALPSQSLEQFSQRFREKIGLPFCVQGVIQYYVRANNLENLLGGGLNRIRIGIRIGDQ